jgi:hypothetical protein
MSQMTEIATYRRLFDEKYLELDELLAALPAAALLWQPFETSPWKGASGSLGWLVAHSISSTVYLLRQAEWIIGQRMWEEVDGDEGREEFGPANQQPDYLRTRVSRSRIYVHQFLGSLSETDLPMVRSHPRRPERQLSLRYTVQHAIEHLSQHIGHAQLTRQLWALHNK